MSWRGRYFGGLEWYGLLINGIVIAQEQAGRMEKKDRCKRRSRAGGLEGWGKGKYVWVVGRGKGKSRDAVYHKPQTVE